LKGHDYDTTWLFDTSNLCIGGSWRFSPPNDWKMLLSATKSVFLSRMWRKYQERRRQLIVAK
jgi:hypothetical protein